MIHEVGFFRLYVTSGTGISERSSGEADLKGRKWSAGESRNRSSGRTASKQHAVLDAFAAVPVAFAYAVAVPVLALPPLAWLLRINIPPPLLRSRPPDAAFAVLPQQHPLQAAPRSAHTDRKPPLPDRTATGTPNSRSVEKVFIKFKKTRSSPPSQPTSKSAL